MIPLQQTDLTELARIALEASGREYPHMLLQELGSDADVKPPRELHPSFYGSYDWHSVVHNHWLLVRTLRRGVPGGRPPPRRTDAPQATHGRNLQVGHGAASRHRAANGRGWRPTNYRRCSR